MDLLRAGRQAAHREVGAQRRRAMHACLLGVCSIALHACVTSAAGGEASKNTAARTKARELSTFERRWRHACEPGGQLGAMSSRGLLYVCDNADTTGPAFWSEDVGDGPSSAIRAALAGARPELRACLRGAEPTAWVKVATTRSCAGAGSPGLSSQAVSYVADRVQQTLSGMDTGPVEEVMLIGMTGPPAPVPRGHPCPYATPDEKQHLLAAVQAA